MEEIQGAAGALTCCQNLVAIRDGAQAFSGPFWPASVAFFAELGIVKERQVVTESKKLPPHCWMHCVIFSFLKGEAPGW